MFAELLGCSMVVVKCSVSEGGSLGLNSGLATFQLSDHKQLVNFMRIIIHTL